MFTTLISLSAMLIRFLISNKKRLLILFLKNSLKPSTGYRKEEKKRKSQNKSLRVKIQNAENEY